MGLEPYVFQNNRNQDLVGVMHQAEGTGPHPCVIVCHGYAGTKVGGSRRFVDFGRYASKKGLSVFRFDFAGSGDSDGDLIDLTLDNELDDLAAAIKTVVNAPDFDSSRIGVIGHCMGGVTAIRAASKIQNVQTVIAWAPFSNLEGTMKRIVGEDAFCILQEGEVADFLYNNQLFQSGPAILEHSNFDMKKEIASVHQPLLVIHGTEDATVPLEEVKRLMKYAKGPAEKRLTVLEGAHHSFPYHKEELFQITVDWFMAQIQQEKGDDIHELAGTEI